MCVFSIEGSLDSVVSGVKGRGLLFYGGPLEAVLNLSCDDLG